MAKTGVEVSKQGKRLTLDICYPEETREILLELESSRNNSISSFKETSPWDKETRYHAIRQDLEGEIWFPVVDAEILPGMYGQAELEGIIGGKTEYAWNGWLWPERKAASNRLLISAQYLTEWENGCFLNQSGVRMKRFCLFLPVPVFLTISRRITKTVTMLCESWSGKITAYYKDRMGTYHKIDTCEVEAEGACEAGLENGSGLKLEAAAESAGPEWGSGGEGFSADTLYKALKRNLDFILNSRIVSADHPLEGGFYLFYDIEARTYRLPGWLWGWGPVIRLLMESGRIAAIDSHYGKGRLMEAAIKAGRVTLKGQVPSEDQELNGLGTARWDPNLAMESGYRQRVCGASDSGFLCGWAWCRLYQETGDPVFRDAALAYGRSSEYLIGRYKIPPQDYMPEENSWTKHTLDESGFGVKAFEGLYLMTGDRHYQSVGRDYIENHLDKFERKDGLWERLYLRESDTTETCMYMTRGQGWAMEGLISAWNLTKDSRYREKACRMAETVVRFQKEDGSWNFIMNEPEERVGADDKGTPLWALLLYRLYKADNNPVWLEAARRALSWCIKHQITVGDAEGIGGLAVPTPQSGVVYRPWFTLPCLYTAGFFGLAILEELSIRENM